MVPEVEDAQEDVLKRKGAQRLAGQEGEEILDEHGCFPDGEDPNLG